MSLTRIARTEVNWQLTAGSKSGLVRKGHGFQNRNRIHLFEALNLQLNYRFHICVELEPELRQF